LPAPFAISGSDFAKILPKAPLPIAIHPYRCFLKSLVQEAAVVKRNGPARSICHRARG